MRDKRTSRLDAPFLLRERGPPCPTSLSCPLVFVAKYQLGLSRNAIHATCKQTVSKISTDFDINLMEIGQDENHGSLLIEFLPMLDFLRWANPTKGASSRTLRQILPAPIDAPRQDQFQTSANDFNAVRGVTGGLSTSTSRATAYQPDPICDKRRSTTRLKAKALSLSPR